MSCSLNDSRVRTVIDALHTEVERVDPPLLAAAEGKDVAERAGLDPAHLTYVRDPANGYASVTVPIGDSLELSGGRRV